MNLDDFSNGQANATRLAVGLEFRSRPSFPAGEAPAYESSADYAVAEGLRSDAIEIKIEAGSFRVLAKKAIVVMGLNVSKGSLRVRKAPGKPKRGSSYQFDAPIALALSEGLFLIGEGDEIYGVPEAATGHNEVSTVAFITGWAAS